MPARNYAKFAVLAAAARIAPLAVQLIATPFVLSTEGVGVYAVWALLMTTIGLMLTADLGVVSIMQRYHGIARGEKNPAYGGRITATVLIALLSVLAIVSLAGPLIADGVLAIVQVAPGLHEQAWIVFRNAGTLAVLQLVGLAFSAYLAAHNMFIKVAVASIGARSVLVAGIVVALSMHLGLVGLLIAAYADAIAAIVLGAVFARKHLLNEVRGPVNRRELKDLWGYAWKNQVSALGYVAQRESDVVIAALLLPAALQATVAATAQLAAAAAFAPTVALVPLFTSLSVRAANDVPGALREATNAEANWARIIWPFCGLMLGLGPFLAAAWLGPELLDVAPVMLLLSVGFLLVLLNGVRSQLVRALGYPGIESQSFLWLIAVKVTVGIPATLLLGIYGLAISTVIAAAVGVVVLRLKLHRRIPGFKVKQVGQADRLLAVATLVLSGTVSALVHVGLPDRWIQFGALLVWATLCSLGTLLVVRHKSNRSELRTEP
jgi:O-antigen/teichoic acid export membrane protein